MLLLNQDCKEMVLDCDEIPSNEPPQVVNGVPQLHYVVAGVPRAEVTELHQACSKTRIPETALQISPLALFNAFEFGNEETFNNQAFALVDIGHVSTTVVVGVKRELILVRSLEYGGRSLVEELICHGAADYEEIVKHLQEEEILTVENARLSLTELVRTISSSIGFFEARRDAAIPRVYISGGIAKSDTILKILTEELQLPCETWDPFAKCEITVSAARKPALAEQLPLLGVACGAAAEILTAR
jgi:Tfp pilus assembly PilM family ATPase